MITDIPEGNFGICIYKNISLYINICIQVILSWNYIIIVCSEILRSYWNLVQLYECMGVMMFIYYFMTRLSITYCDEFFIKCF